MAIKTVKTACDVCGRALPTKKSKGGRPRERHRECSKLIGYWRAFDAELDRVRFAPGSKGDAKIKALRGRLMTQSLNQKLRADRAKRSDLARDFGAR